MIISIPHDLVTRLAFAKETFEQLRQSTQDSPRCPSTSRNSAGCAPAWSGDLYYRGCGFAYYWLHRVDFIPVCDDFTQSASSAHFSFAELNTGDYSWAIIRDRLLTGLENTRSNYGYPMPVNSGYRNPARNQRVGGEPDSRHMYGDAADIDVVDNNSNRDKSDDSDALARAAERAGATEILEYPARGYSHVHLAWER